MTQGYFIQLLEKGYLRDFDPSLGRFRVFLKASMTHFLSNEREKAHAWKRGGRAAAISFQVQEVEDRYRMEPADRLTPEDIFEHRWALTVVARALARLRAELRKEGQEARFERLKGFLTGEEPAAPYAETAAVLRTSEAAVRCIGCGGDSGRYCGKRFRRLSPARTKSMTSCDICCDLLHARGLDA